MSQAAEEKNEYSWIESIGLPLIYRGLLPDFVIRGGIRSSLGSMVSSQNSVAAYSRIALKQAYVADLKARPLAEHTLAANEQHYEVPAAFYEFVMGANKKYSCGLWPASGACTLDQSEASALELVCERAQLTNTAGLRVLDMGCGWGSFSLFAAARYPLVSFTGVSNSASQREYIMGQAAARGLANVNIVTADINAFDGAGKEFDRVVSIEMMEHVKNYQLLLKRVSSWLRPSGLMFVHIFTHAHTPFHYTDGWMAKSFFSGGQMPSDDLLLHFQENLALQGHWAVNGKHYERTCNEWLLKMDSNRSQVMEVLGKVYGAEQAYRRYVDWRLFFLACAELFGYNNGEEWAVSHYLFSNKA